MKKKPFIIEAKLDLHHYTIQAAYEAFHDFIEICIENEFTNLLVVTGKGSGEKNIRQEFPHWCENNNIKNFIKSVRQAEIQHGGDGAFYVMLK